jgi:hypothetical protein
MVRGLGMVYHLGLSEEIYSLSQLHDTRTQVVPMKFDIKLSTDLGKSGSGIWGNNDGTLFRMASNQTCGAKICIIMKIFA